jgi:heme A synthase
VVGLTALVVALLAAAWSARRAPGVTGPGGVLRPAALAAVLLVVQSLLGAVTVWLELPPAVVVVHLGNAMALLAATLVAALRAFRGPTAAPSPPSRIAKSAVAAAAMGALALLLGGLTANLHAGAACQGFPLCNGRLWPAAGAGGLVHLHWIHRLVAYALALHLVGMVAAAWRRAEPRPVRVAVGLSVGVLVLHVVVAAVMVLEFLPLGLRAAHAALGALVWVALVYLAWSVAGSPAAGARVAAVSAAKR